MTNKEITTKLKRDKRVSKFMQDYRYNYKVTMVTDLAELAYSFYLEGFNNGVKQYPVPLTNLVKEVSSYDE